MKIYNYSELWKKHKKQSVPLTAHSGIWKANIFKKFNKSKKAHSTQILFHAKKIFCPLPRNRHCHEYETSERLPIR
jgi:hypothetical protein